MIRKKWCNRCVSVGLVTFNLLLMVGGAVLINTQIISQVVSTLSGTDHIDLVVSLDEIIKNGAAIGIVILVIATFGIFVGCFKARWMIGLYLTLLVLLVLAELAVIIAATAFPDTFNSESVKLMRESLMDYQGDCRLVGNKLYCTPELDPVSTAWNTLQFEMHCCGSKDLTDYANSTAPKFKPRTSNAPAPLTCCVHDTEQSFQDSLTHISVSNETRACFTAGYTTQGYYTTGCFDALLHSLVTTPAAIGVMVAVSVLQVALVALSIIRMLQLRTRKKLDS